MTQPHRGLLALPGRPRLLLLLLPPLALLGPRLAAGAACPEEDDAASRAGAAEPTSVVFTNAAGQPLTLFWVNADGGQQQHAILDDQEQHTETTYPGHVFKLRSRASGRLVHVARIPMSPDKRTEVTVRACDGMVASAEPLDTSRWPEFERLAAAAWSPCVGPSRNWSCVRDVSPKELGQRNPQEYGFTAEEAAATKVYSAGGTKAGHDFDQQPFIPNVTAYSGGYLKMDMSDRLKAVFYPWYEQRKKDSMKHHLQISGFYTNDHKVQMDQITLDAFPDVRRAIIDEMREVLQWWTGVRLRHTMTFGVRVYRRGAMLLNHLDRRHTHLASAVIQVEQEVDEGWPLEVLHPHSGGAKEVYLQPGQMVFYEGARLAHGRPMRFKGDEFANVFTHFVPLDWTGPDGKRNPHFDSPPPPVADRRASTEL